MEFPEIFPILTNPSIVTPPSPKIPSVTPVIKKKQTKKIELDNKLVAISKTALNGETLTLLISPNSKEKKAGVYVINPCSPKGSPDLTQAYVGIAGHQSTPERNEQEFREAVQSVKQQGVHQFIRAAREVRARRTLAFDGLLEGEISDKPKRRELHQAEQETLSNLAHSGVYLWNQKLSKELRKINEANKIKVFSTKDTAEASK
jgi:hypothetical protein